jgi:cytochrome P450 family 144
MKSFYHREKCGRLSLNDGAGRPVGLRTQHPGLRPTGYESPFRGHYRHVVRDTTLCGFDVPADSRLLLMWGAANRDPRQFNAPNEFRLDRTGAKGHVTFGKGAHFCIGAALARLEAQIVLRMLLDQTTWISAGGIGRWLPSILVRRLERLHLNVG